MGRGAGVGGAGSYNRLMRTAFVSSSKTIPQPCALYVHIPFCETKCGYCDFYSVALKDRDPGPLVSRLLCELRTRVDQAHATGYAVQTVFFGGGTPTLLPFDQLRELLQTVRELVAADPVVEFTVEANPATVDDGKAALLTEHGVTRVSMGAQSFFPAELAALERLHTPEDIAPSVATLRRHGLDNFNLDLIFGIPGQTPVTWGESLRRAMDLAPQHIACYGLTYEPGTRLTAQQRVGHVVACDENTEAELYLLALETLSGAGFDQYETSNYARPGRECRHNLMYWRNRPYIGVGPSAAGCLSERRHKNVPDIAAYIRLMDERGHAEMESEVVAPEMLMLELPMMQLRLVEGLSIGDFVARTGVDPRAVFHEPLERFLAGGQVTVSESHIALTREGRLLSDAILRELAGALGRRERKLTVLGSGGAVNAASADRAGVIGGQDAEL